MSMASTAPMASNTWELINSVDQLRYYHASDATAETLAACEGKSLIFEIDFAVMSEQIPQYSPPGIPYIGHSSRFYGIPRKVFPASNVSIEEFRRLMLKPENRNIKVLLDIKTVNALHHVGDFVEAIGKDRCIAHAFILDWTGDPPSNISRRPHWVDENMPIAVVDEVLQKVGIPLIANCRGYNDEYVVKHDVVGRMIADAKNYKSIVALGLYYSQAAMPSLDFLRAFNDAGYKGWVNANIDLSILGEIRWVGMCDDRAQATLQELNSERSPADANERQETPHVRDDASPE